MAIASPGSLPLTVDEVTAAALTDMLEADYPGTIVSSVQFVEVIRGTCTKIRLRVTYDPRSRAHGLPETLCLKGNFERHGLAGSIYPREVWFYRHLAPRIASALPRCFHAVRDGQQALILMEDLRSGGASFAGAADAASLAQVRSLLRCLAAVHGAMWESRELQTLADEPPRDSGCAVLDFSEQVLYQAQNFEPAMRRPRAAGVAPSLRDLDGARRSLDRLVRHFDAGPRCLIHGDAHLGNTFSTPATEAAAYVDWQTYARGHWALDVSHLLCTALDTVDRRRHERNLLEFYLDELERNGGAPPDFEEAWRMYRCMAFYGFAWVLCPPALQPEETCTRCAARVLAAIDDLGTLEALEAPPGVPA